MGMLKEFREFAVKGMRWTWRWASSSAGAFGKIVTSLVNDVNHAADRAAAGQRAFFGTLHSVESCPKRAASHDVGAGAGGKDSDDQLRPLHQQHPRFRDRRLLHLPGRQTNEPNQADRTDAGGADHEGVSRVPFDDPVEGEAMCLLHGTGPTAEAIRDPSPHKPEAIGELPGERIEHLLGIWPGRPDQPVRSPWLRRAIRVAARRRR